MVISLSVAAVSSIVIAIELLRIEWRLARLERQAKEARGVAFADRLLSPLVRSPSDFASRAKTERRARR